MDDPDRVPAFTVNVVALDQKTYEVNLYCDEQGHPTFARCRITDLNSEALPEAALPILQSLGEHLLSVLRLTYRPDVSWADPSAAWSFIKNGDPAKVSLLMERFGNTSYDPEPTRNLFIHSFEVRELMRLYVDGMDARLPLQYQYLSLYKLLEVRYRKHGQWKKKELSDLLKPFAKNFIDQGINGEPSTVLHEIRDKCAHIKTKFKGGSEALGVTHLNLSAVARVERILPVLRAVCAVTINERVAGKFVLRTDVVLPHLQRANSDV